MGGALDPPEVARRIEDLLDRMGLGDDGADGPGDGGDLPPDGLGRRSARQAGEELVGLLMRFYGAGLEQTVAIVRTGGGDALVHRLAADPLVGGLLALHELHPVDLRTRVEHAMQTARRKLGSHGSDATLLGVDPDGTVRVGLGAGGCGAATVRQVVAEEVGALAPDSPGVSFVEAPQGPTLLQIGPRPADTGARAGS